MPNITKLAGAAIIAALAVTTQSQAAQAQVAVPVKAPDGKLVAKTPENSSISETVKDPLDLALAPLLNYQISSGDIKNLKSAFKAIYKGDMPGALLLTDEIKDPVAKKLITWYRLRAEGSEATPETIEKFRSDNPNWPDQKKLRQRAEQALFLDRADADRVLAFFAGTQPEHASGKAALARAYLAKGEEAKALPYLRSAWRDHDLSKKIEKAIAASFKSELTSEDHNWRLNRFLLNDGRYGRPGRLRRAKKVTTYLKGVDRKRANARLTIWRSYSKRRRKARLAAAAKAIKKLPSEGNADWGLYFHKIQMTRRKGDNEGAWKMLLAAPVEREKIHFPDHWWIERRVNAYDALYAKKYETAYKIVSRTGPLSVNEANESGFMAGWIALRFLNKPKKALEHFRAISKTADGPRSGGRAAYWLGRTYEALGDKATARDHFLNGAKFTNTFYGQLSRQKVDPKAHDIKLVKPQVPPAEVLKKYIDNDAIKALMITHRMKNRGVMRRFLYHYRRYFKTEQEMLLAAHLAQSIGDTQLSVRTGKTGMGRGFNLVHYAYPTHAFPSFKPLRTSPEKAMLYGLARQESEFNTLITSIAGARGVLQVMGVTARHVCRDYKIKCGSRAGLKRRLSKDPSFNASLASAYIGDRKDEFGGSYILTFAGYNAGPGRARYWIRKNGDPRRRDVDPIDWIELIHIKETRHYVKKVMANLQIYRARLGSPQNALRISDDIMRGRDGLRASPNTLKAEN